jgi:NAD(P)-dependent dehydrogenase (short-subunit alcohol dehydrogenase family)
MIKNSKNGPSRATRPTFATESGIKRTSLSDGVSALPAPSRSISCHSASRGVGLREHHVSPGVTETPMIAKYSAENRTIQQGRVPLGRLAQADEIASVGTFLISDGARYINGETIIVDGGASFG